MVFMLTVYARLQSGRHRLSGADVGQPALDSLSLAEYRVAQNRALLSTGGSTMRAHPAAVFSLLLLWPAASAAADLPRVTEVDLQPLARQAKRIADALDHLGEPLTSADRMALKVAEDNQNKKEGVAAIQTILDKRCLAG